MNKTVSLFWIFGLFLIIAFSNTALAEGEYLLLPAERTAWAEKGVTFEAAYLGEVDSNLSGGLEEGTTYLGRFDFVTDLDTEKMGLWSGGSLHIDLMDTHGEDKFTGRYVGDLQTVSNIEAPRAFKVFELWYQQNFLEDKLSILVGSHDLNSEFYASDYGALYLNSSFGIGPEITANVPVSIFPTAAPTARVRLTFSENFEIAAAIYDGDPSEDGINQHGTHFHFGSDQGAMAIAEAAFHYGVVLNDQAKPLPGALKLGAWHHSADIEDLTSVNVDPDTGDETPVAHSHDYGFYGIIDQALFREKDNEDQGLSAFLQIGGVPDDRNTVDLYVGGGLNYKGLIPARDEDEFGVAVAMASMSDKLRASTTEIESAETTLEVTYKAQITPSFAVQPSFQFVSDPSADPAVEDASVFMLRFELVV